MSIKHWKKRITALILALVMMFSLCACSATGIYDILTSSLGLSVSPGERLLDSKWINSDIEGSIDENTQLDLKDDFHTTVNRDWFLENNAEGNEEINSFNEVSDALLKDSIDLLSPGGNYEPDPNVMSKEELNHLENMIWDLMDLAGSMDKRNELGVEPLRPYLEAIDSIDSLEDLTEYMKNTNGDNLSTENFFNFAAGAPVNERDFYTVHIFYPNNLLLQSPSSYTFLGYYSHNALKLEYDALHHVLSQLGYSSKEIDELISSCFNFESKFHLKLPSSDESRSSNYRNRGDKIYTLEELEQRQGNFPLTELLEAAGLADSDTFRLFEPDFLHFMSKYYTEANLETMKNYFKVHTVLNALPYLDEECMDLANAIYDAQNGDFASSNEEAEAEEQEEEDDNQPDPEDLEEQLSPQEMERLELAQEYVFPNLYEAYQLAYIGRHCSSTMKADILKMLEDIREYYRELLSTTEWLTQETRDKALEKLDKMEFNVIYPNELTDYSGLVYEGYDEGGNLLDAICAINAFNAKPDTSLVNQPMKRSDWDLNTASTMEINAAYYLERNCIVILAGICSGGFFYDENAPIEQNYARLGMVLGHEMTHAFDTGGYHYDGDGLQNSWWTNEDEVAFRLRSDKLANYYSVLNVFPGMVAGYNGQNVQGEVIADMGGIKCMLALAEDIPDFDYDLFFRSYANVWRSQTSLSNVMVNANDVHPLGFLRTNVTLMQFDKFHETYDIGPGDGMYMAPEDRIMVW